jgi:hypothetical protein
VPKDYNQVSVYYLIAFYSMPIVFNGWNVEINIIE